MRRALGWALAACAWSCAGAPERPEQRSSAPPAAAGEPAGLRADWSALSPAAFERWIDALDGPLALDPRARGELALALDEPGAAGVHAAVLLGRQRTPEAAELLLARLERRVASAERNGDAADVVAARALALSSAARALAPRLEALAVGERPHPDLEVRVECAASALALGRDAVQPLLLRVLLLGTELGRGSEAELGTSPTTAWARGRASAALAARAGIPDPYRADASLAARVDAVRVLREALARPRGALAP